MATKKLRTIQREKKIIEVITIPKTSALSKLLDIFDSLKQEYQLEYCKYNDAIKIESVDSIGGMFSLYFTDDTFELMDPELILQ